MKPCIFCSNHRTKKRGEHLWDNWLNREGGKELRDRSTTSYFGPGGALIRTHRSTGLDVTLDVVCDSCNHTWMSDLSTRAQHLMEPSLRRDKPQDYDAVNIVTLAAFIFLKSAVLEWSSAMPRGRVPCISRALCVSFRASLVRPSSGTVALPPHLQIWIARYQRSRKMEAQAFIDELTGRGPFKGYRILLINYLVGSFIFQLTLPRWAKRTRNRPAPPFFQVIGDLKSVPIWPDVTFASWPPPLHIDSRSLQNFRERFTHVLLPAAQ
jgi:hypothetical protein